MGFLENEHAPQSADWWSQKEMDDYDDAAMAAILAGKNNKLPKNHKPFHQAHPVVATRGSKQ